MIAPHTELGTLDVRRDSIPHANNSSAQTPSNSNRSASVCNSDSTNWNWEGSFNQAFSAKSMSYDDLRRAFQLVTKNSDAPLPMVEAMPAGGNCPPGELMQNIAATVVQCSVRRLLAKRLRQRLVKRKQQEFAEQCQRDMEQLSALQIQGAVRRHQAQKEVQARRMSNQYSSLGIASSAAVVIRPPSVVPSPEPGVSPSGETASSGDFSVTGGELMQNCAASVIQSSFRRHRVNKRIALRSATNTPAVPLPDDDAEMPGVHTALVGERQALSARLRASVEHSRGPGDTASSFAGWGSGRGAGLTAVFAAATDFIIDARNAGRPLWGVRALHAVAMGLQAPNFLPDLELSRWVEGPLGSVLPLTAHVTRQF